MKCTNVEAAVVDGLLPSPASIDRSGFQRRVEFICQRSKMLKERIGDINDLFLFTNE